ncbi:MAG TPA: hypothetical protein VK474_01225 [Chthoniobacterales bacterium]|nr:hypothetical protein [Chthoniobacterales bacterium]
MRYKTNESQRGQADVATFRLAQFLGVFSLLLGAGELIWGGAIARHIGLGDLEWLVRVYGAREFVNGVLILMSKDPTPWIWLRVVGDGLDAATLVWGYTRDPSHGMGVLIAFIAVTPVVIADIYCAIKLSSESKTPLSPAKDHGNRGGLSGSAG